MTTRTGHRVRHGVTLVELIVAIALLGLMAGVAGVAFVRRDRQAPADPLAEAVTGARARAVATGRTVQVTVDAGANGAPVDVTAFADGSVLADSIVVAHLTLDRLSGRPTTTIAEATRAQR